MMSFTLRHRLIGGSANFAVLLCAGLIASPAAAEVKGGVDVTLAGRAASNPFNGEGSGLAVAISPSIDPWLLYNDPGTKIDLRGSLLTDRYIEDYGTVTTGQASLAVEQAMSERLTLTGGAAYRNTNNTAGAFLLQQPLTPDTVIPPGTPLPDVSTAGLRTRVEALNGNVGAGLALSAYDSISLNLTGSMVRSDAVGNSDFNTGGGGLSYSRQFSPRTSGQISVQFNRVDYLGTVESDSVITSPTVGVTHQLNARLKLTANVGVSISRTKVAPGVDLHSTALSGNASLCGSIYRGSMCANLSRTVQPSILGGVGISTAGAFSFGRQIGRSGSLGVGVNYSRNEQQLEQSRPSTQDLLGAFVSYTHRFSDRFSVFASPSYSKPLNSQIPRDANVELRAGLKYRFGAIH